MRSRAFFFCKGKVAYVPVVAEPVLHWHLFYCSIKEDPSRFRELDLQKENANEDKHMYT